MMTDKDLTDDVLDEIIAGAKTSMEQYLALSLKAERAANRQQNAQQNIPENIPTLRDGLAVIRSLGEIDAAKIQAERDSLNSPLIPDGWADMLQRWLVFGRGMQNAGSQLPLNLIAETEAMLAAAPQQEAKNV
ncbi:hypothetical protein [Escherichia coli]|uniref:hypothetical protein n=1 Tax=Escherichia coli TaxID=562 RepID=UPI0018C6D4FF|nr:hypothetical protein [Escherichia coli]